MLNKLLLGAIELNVVTDVFSILVFDNAIIFA